MPNRYQINQRAIIYSFLVSRDGEYCLICGPSKKHKKLEIDHADGDKDNADPGNLHLVCHRHNCIMRNMTRSDHLKMIRTHAAKNVAARERQNSIPITRILKDLVDYRQGSPEMKANSYCEIQYRDWILVEVQRLKAVRKEDAIFGGAEVVGCSPVTTRRYLQKLTSVIGVLKEGKNGHGDTVIMYREGK